MHYRGTSTTYQTLFAALLCPSEGEVDQPKLKHSNHDTKRAALVHNIVVLHNQEMQELSDLIQNTLLSVTHAKKFSVNQTPKPSQSNALDEACNNTKRKKRKKKKKEYKRRHHTHLAKTKHRKRKQSRGGDVLEHCLEASGLVQDHNRLHRDGFTVPIPHRHHINRCVHNGSGAVDVCHSGAGLSPKLSFEGHTLPLGKREPIWGVSPRKLSVLSHLTVLFAAAVAEPGADLHNAHPHQRRVSQHTHARTHTINETTKHNEREMSRR